jgi:hypothetical protein
MPFVPAARVYGPAVGLLRRRRRFTAGLGRASNGSQVLWSRPWPRPLPPSRCTPGDAYMANAEYDFTSCRWIPNPVTPPVASGPVPAGFPTNQLFMAPDGSQWAYSTSQRKWMNVGTPYNLGQPPNPPAPSTSTPITPPAPPVPTGAAPPAAPVPASVSPYDRLISFATESSLIPSVPNWVVGVGVLMGLKVVEGMRGRR